MTDGELMAAVAARSHPAMAAIFDRYKDVVLGVAMSGLRGDRDRAMDVLSEVMLVVWRKAHTFEGRSSARTWILGIAIHKIHDQLRLGRRTEPLAEIPEKPEDAVLPQEPRMASERQALERCLAKLSPAHQEVLHLAFFCDLPCAEIAATLKVAPGTVRSRIHYAARMLRRCMQQKGVSS